MGSRSINRLPQKEQFLVRWVGYPKYLDSWKPEYNVSEDLKTEYWQKIENENG